MKTDTLWSVGRLRFRFWNQLRVVLQPQIILWLISPSTVYWDKSVCEFKHSVVQALKTALTDPPLLLLSFYCLHVYFRPSICCRRRCAHHLLFILYLGDEQDFSLFFLYLRPHLFFLLLFSHILLVGKQFRLHYFSHLGYPWGSSGNTTQQIWINIFY